MAAVGLLLDRAAAGGGVLAVYGPPGAGRTALAEAAAGRAGRLWARGRRCGWDRWASKTWAR
ncbi:MAG TPA: hypothetical protein DHU96_02425 [Actinobacteria bacterium]|nr:hypothetical protein [Actinomycetota bacterium]